MELSTTPPPDLVSDWDESDDSQSDYYDDESSTMTFHGPHSPMAKCTLSQMAIRVICGHIHSKYRLFGDVTTLATVLTKLVTHFNFNMNQLMDCSMLIDAQLNINDGIPSACELNQLLFETVAFTASQTRRWDLRELQRLSGIQVAEIESQFFKLQNLQRSGFELGTPSNLKMELKISLGKIVKLV